MHLADALVSPGVAGGAGVVSAALIAVDARKLKGVTEREGLVPMMGVLGAFVFAAQMINFSIPGTGSSGHIVGGVMLAALLGPWAALITLASVLVVQCLLFADGGLMALGCNILNMGVCSTLIAYPLVFKPLAGDCGRMWRVVAASVCASVVGLELGAVMVTVETELSGVTALPFGSFLGLMTGIHLLIGLGEGIATAAVLCFVMKFRPGLLSPEKRQGGSTSVLAWFLGGAILLGGCFAWIASEDPDGLEWSVGRLTGGTEIAGGTGDVEVALAAVQQKTSLLPDYDSTWSGIIGCAIVLVLVWAVTSLISFRRKNKPV
ncbi:MAG: energy-coupling factor ABC transporter permease [Duncaniella sp.]|nr:energy-coupling factor ABC transporter permease [Duncaniella sp.]